MSNSSGTCSHSNPDYIENPAQDEWTKWSGCAVPNNSTRAPVLKACCDALDDFVFTFQDEFPIFMDSNDISDCWTTCMVNVSDVYYADSMNITNCIIANTEDEDDGGNRLCGGPARETPNLAPAALEHNLVVTWGIATFALLACLRVL